MGEAQLVDQVIDTFEADPDFQLRERIEALLASPEWAGTFAYAPETVRRRLREALWGKS
jgi:hypothetical protein